VISTPDRRTYSASSGQQNPFHERELACEEFLELLDKHFPCVTAWGQRTITGSHMTALRLVPHELAGPDFFVERAGDEWRIAGDPTPLYTIALASKTQLPAVGKSSTLADCGLELVRRWERAVRMDEEKSRALEREQAQQSLAFERERAADARALREHEAQMQAELAQREREIQSRRDEIGVLREKITELRRDIDGRSARISSVETELASAIQLSRRAEESVTWQAFQRARGRLYRTIGEKSVLARGIGLALRLAGRTLIKTRTPTPPEPTDEAPTPGNDLSVEVISMPQYDDPTVSLIIPLHAHSELTRACLQSICDNTTHVSYEVILVDDVADPESKRLLERVTGAEIIRNVGNIGYLRSMNTGARVARGRWLVLMNNDTEVQNGWLNALIGCAESSEDVGVVTPKYLDPDGQLVEAGGIIWRDGTGVNYGRGDAPDLFQYEYRRETDYGSAAALMVRKELWDAVGGFDERYRPMYYEDADLCFEARKHGFRVLYEPEAVVVHVEGATAGRDPEAGFKRYQEKNRPTFVAKWSQQLETEHLRPALTNVRLAANRHVGPHVLVIDHCVPMPDRDAGSLRMFSIMRTLLDLGARVTFMPDNFSPVEPYTRDLQRMGIEVLYGALDVNAEFATIGHKLQMVILSRPHPASRWLDAVRRFAPQATVLYDTVDLHWLREARESASAGWSDVILDVNNGIIDVDSIAPRAEALRELELAMIRAADTTLVVTDCERVQVEQDVPDAKVRVLPTVHEVQPYVAPPEDRAGIVFVGSFAHPPNIDAALTLVKNVMPMIWSKLHDVRVTIVGSDPPDEVRALASSLVDVTGWIEDLQPLLDESRLMVAALRYGAGLKGKITQCLAAGLPVVTTPIGAEGLLTTPLMADGSALDEQCLLIAEDPRGLAAETLRLYTDDVLWRRLSLAGREFVREHCSQVLVADRLTELLDAPASSSTIRQSG
jgi:GT2 family glycosyltransferase